MPTHSYNLPRLNPMTNKAVDLNFQVEEHIPAVPLSPKPLDHANIVSTEPPAPPASFESEDGGERDWKDGLCACFQDKSHC